MNEYLKLLGLRFLNNGYTAAIRLLSGGAFMVVPSAPSLAILEGDTNYKQAMVNSDFAIPDSGLMVLLLRLLKGIQIKKLSGLEFLRFFLNEDSLKKNRSLFLVNPSQEEQVANHQYLLSLGIQIDEGDHYVAPVYGDSVIEDPELLAIIKRKKPRFVLINLGGGVQEKLGCFLKLNLDYKPGIICTGAAIAFLTGRQVQIPEWVDSLYLGWLWRCLSRSSVYVPRYLSGLKLIPMILKSKVEIINN